VENIPDDETGSAIKQWAADGSDLSRLIKIDFFVAVRNQEEGRKVMADPELKIFAHLSLEEDEETGQWTCYCSKSMVPRYDDIIELEALLTSIASRHGAQYDGFGSFGNAGN